MVGFTAAPVSQVLSLIMVVASFTARSLGDEELNFDLEKMMNNGEYSRLISSFITFTTTAQMLVGITLFYICRQFERLWGSRKFGAFTFVSFVLSTLLLSFVTVFGLSMDIKINPTAGPYPLICALLVMYKRYVPSINSSVMDISEKTWTYMLALYFALSGGWATLIPSLVGVMVGIFYSDDHLRVQSFRFPTFLEIIFNLIGNLLGIFLPLGGPAPLQDHSNAAAAAVQAAAEANSNTSGDNNDGREENDNRVRQPSWSEATQARLHDFGGLGEAIAPPSEEDIETITNLGFDRAKAVHALEQCDNNVQAAANYCLRD